ncbi:hypothetical protein V2I01_32350 [Micromonospora sp. BRA006-A]|nr:hypothetical protein [Micromonospora sp. BRA006-A]
MRHLADRIVGPGLKIPLIRTGTFHDHVTVVTVQGSLRDVSDGDLLGHDKVGTADKRTARSTVTSARDDSRSAELSLDPVSWARSARPRRRCSAGRAPLHLGHHRRAPSPAGGPPRATTDRRSTTTANRLRYGCASSPPPSTSP